MYLQIIKSNLEISIGSYKMSEKEGVGKQVLNVSI